MPMNREYHKWFSPHLNKDMELLLFGTGGRPVLAFPTSMGRFYQNEDFSLINTLSDRLSSGQLQIICVDSVDNESWYNRQISLQERARRHDQYEQYLIQEVLPFFSQRNDRVTGELNVTGASFGAYHSVNFAFRHPDIVRRVLAMSGAYSLQFLVSTGYNSEAYFNSPMDYLPSLNDDWYLSRMRQQDIILAAGSEDICRASTTQLSGILWDKGVPNNLDIWDGAWHDWPWWKLMVLKYL
ncbi:MAG: alpha/beta hydrolase-fold protein [Chloroflexota bacterium]|nr:alpha/beta hydrolase-fold protein [Chloroflexota bacterium]